MLQAELKNQGQMLPSRRLRNPRLVMQLVIAIVLLALLGVSCVARLALWHFTPQAEHYFGSLLAIGEADYSPWGTGPMLPALDPRVAEALAQSDEEAANQPSPPLRVPNDVVPVAVIEVPVTTPAPAASPTPTPPRRPPATPVAVIFPPEPTTLPGAPPSPSRTAAAMTQPGVPLVQTTVTVPLSQPDAPTVAVAEEPSATSSAPASQALQPSVTPGLPATTTATPTQPPIHTPTRAATSTLTPSPTHTPVPPTATPIQAPALEATPSATPSPTSTLTPSPTHTPVPPTATPIQAPALEATPSATPSPTSTLTPSPTHTPVPPTATPTHTPVPPAILIGDVTVTEGNSGTVEASFVVSLSAASDQEVTVEYATQDATATEPDDYTATSGTLIFAPGETSRTISVEVLGDTLDEPDEIFFVNLSPPTNATLADSQGIGTITDDDLPPDVRLRLSSDSISEGMGPVFALVELSAPSGQTVTVGYTTSGSTTAGDDYIINTDSVSFKPGETSRFFEVEIIDDTLAETDETLTLTLTLDDPPNATPGSPDTATLTIRDDEPRLRFSQSNYSVDKGAGMATITVILSAPAPEDVTVDYTTGDGSAIAGSDYEHVSRTLTIPGGTTGQTFTVAIINDDIGEPDEDVRLTLSNVSSNARLEEGGDTATLTILDNEPRVQLNWNGYSVDEGAGMATITVTLSAPAPEDVTVDYATGDGSAIAVEDYTAVTGTLTITQSQTSASFTVPIREDTQGEPDEDIWLTLSNISDNAWPGWPTSTKLTILDNEPRIAFDTSTLTVSEGSGMALITVIRSRDLSGEVEVSLTTGDGTATAGSDYTSFSDTYIFTTDQISTTFEIGLIDDGAVEMAETVQLMLSSPTEPLWIASPNPATLTINDNEPRIRFRSQTYEVNENARTTTIEVRLVDPNNRLVTYNQPVSVAYMVTGGSATNGDDYSVDGTALTFAPGENRRFITVNLVDDDIDEPTETVTLRLENPDSYAALAFPDQATLQITDDDGPAVQFSAAGYSVNEGLGEATITVELSEPSSETVEVEYITEDDTALAGQDYLTASGTLTFNPGETSKTFTVTILNDMNPEPEETITLRLSNPSNVTLGSPDTATLAVADNDG